MFSLNSRALVSSVVATAVFFFADCATVQADNVTNLISISHSTFAFNALSNTYDIDVAVKNSGPNPLLGPIKLLLTSAQPRSTSFYKLDGRMSYGVPYTTLFVSNNFLPPGASVTQTVNFVSSSSPSVGLGVDATILMPETTATLMVHAFETTAYGKPKGPAGAGFTVSVDGLARGLTNDGGIVTIPVPVSSRGLTVSRPPQTVGMAPVVGLTAGNRSKVDVFVSDGGEIRGESDVRIDEVREGLLPINTPSITFRFGRSGRLLSIRTLEDVEMQDAASGTPVYLTDIFSVTSEGTVRAPPQDFFNATRNESGTISLPVFAVGSEGTPYEGNVKFLIGRHKLKVSLLAPLSQPALPLSGIPVDISFKDSDVQLLRESEFSGTVSLPFVPSGQVLIRARTTYNGKSYIGLGAINMANDAVVQVMLLSEQDIPNGSSPIIVTPQ